jgi:hypothetical protein
MQLLRNVALAGLAMAVLAGSAYPAATSTLGQIEEAEAAIELLWTEADLQFRRAIFIEPGEASYGIYQERPDARFSAGEPLILYAEPVGYSWRETEAGDFAFGFDIDLIIKTNDGRILFGQEDFQQIDLRNRHRVRELMLNITLNLDGAPAGEYVLDYRVRDRASAKVATISLPFSIE